MVAAKKFWSLAAMAVNEFKSALFDLFIVDRETVLNVRKSKIWRK